MSAQREQERIELNQKIDDKIDQLVEQTSQQNFNADQIGDNIISQIEQAKTMNDHMDKTKENIDRAVVYVGKIKTTKDQIVAWILSILLIIAIIIVWACAKPIKNK
ncbi:hypothetical protein M9Y10_036270 [Tritrichomonas musculus]|uniref:t-SNARE coiled-coil homology domain-containing protein n=1 Tax=Tritrichomonas musculus TaxID=1915356 RepID=A0ABR2GUW3_9EUKA